MPWGSSADAADGSSADAADGFRRAVNLDRFFTRLNPALRGVLRSPFHWLASSGLVLITVTGRRSGRRYAIPVGYQQEGDCLIVMVSHADTKQWWRNYREPGDVDVHLRGQPRKGRAAVVPPASAEFEEHVEATLRRLPLLDRQFGVRFDKRAGVTEEQLDHLRETCAVVRIDLARPNGRSPRGG